MSLRRKAAAIGIAEMKPTTNHRAFLDALPYVLAIVELAEGPRVTTNIVGCPPEAVRCGLPVEVAFDDVTPEVTLVKFRPAN